LCIYLFILFLIFHSIPIPSPLLPTKILIYVLIHSRVSINRYFILMLSSFYSGFVSFLFLFYLYINNLNFISILFSFYSGLVSFLFLFYLCSHISFLLYSFSPEFSVHFTKKMRPNVKNCPSYAFVTSVVHKLMHL